MVDRKFIGAGVACTHYRLKSDGHFLWALQEVRNHAWHAVTPTILTHDEATTLLWNILDLEFDLRNPA